MSVTINIPSNFRHYANGREVVEVYGSTVGQCLNNLIRQFPSIETGIFDKNGNLFNYIDVYVNLKSSYPEEMSKPVKDGDELHISLFAIAGG